jgi:hypothetical protein
VRCGRSRDGICRRRPVRPFASPPAGEADPGRPGAAGSTASGQPQPAGQARLATNQDSMFDSAKTQIDGLLAELGEEVLQKIDSAYRNLASDDAESISAAMNSVRRLIDGSRIKSSPRPIGRAETAGVKKSSLVSRIDSIALRRSLMTILSGQVNERLV